MFWTLAIVLPIGCCCLLKSPFKAFLAQSSHIKCSIIIKHSKREEGKKCGGIKTHKHINNWCEHNPMWPIDLLERKCHSLFVINKILPYFYANLFIQWNPIEFFHLISTIFITFNLFTLIVTFIVIILLLFLHFRKIKLYFST